MGVIQSMSHHTGSASANEVLFDRATACIGWLDAGKMTLHNVTTREATCMSVIPRPESNEYNDYMGAYISRVPDDGRILEHLESGIEKVKLLVKAMPAHKLDVPHAPGEWTVKEVLLHMIDTERVFAYRALRIARGDTIALPGFEQDDWMPYTHANTRSLDSIFAEYDAVRAASIALLNTFSDEDFLREGFAGGHALTVRAAAYVLVGHELHHLASLQENYA